MEIHFSKSTSFRSSVEHDETCAIIRAMAWHLQTTGLSSPKQAITADPLGGGRSSANVFKLTMTDNSGSGQAFIAKVDVCPDIEDERKRYERFVRSILPSVHRPRLLAFIKGKALAGLCYSYIGDWRGKPDTFTDRLQKGDTGAINIFMKGLFRELRDGWYGPDMIRSDQDIAQRYKARYFAKTEDISRNEQLMRHRVARLFDAQADDNHYRIDDLTFPFARTIIFGNYPTQPYQSCILHGDLNSDNILVGHDPAEAVLIDFRKTGRGHVYEDLVALEASVRINHPQDTAPYDSLSIEHNIAMNTGRANMPAYAACIRRIRAAALEHFGQYEEDWTYHFAVAAIGLRLMQATDLSEIAHARITASTLWASHILSGHP